MALKVHINACTARVCVACHNAAYKSLHCGSKHFDAPNGSVVSYFCKLYFNIEGGPFACKKVCANCFSLCKFLFFSCLC